MEARWAQEIAQKTGRDDLALHRVVEVQRDHVQVHDGQTQLRARVRHSLQQELAQAADALAVGDWVLTDEDPFGARWVQVRVPPRNQLARRLHDGRDKVARVVIVSNVDSALLVMGLDHDFNLRRLERYLTLAQLAGVAPLVVLTKADLALDPAQALARVAKALPAEVPVVAVDGRAGAARQALAPWLRPGHTLVLLGSSGAGKSTLTNTLCGQPLQDTGPTREGDGRGRHTTTVRSLHLALDGACIIDTPGLRTLRLDSDEAALRSVYEDVSTLSLQCRFRDCRHEGEPGCAVRDGVAAERLKSWHKLQREAQRDTMSALERQRQLSEWKQRGRAGRNRAREKRE
ncbi:MAG: ribosome small subunit-dependent GTPase A [Rubrivivax sp.]|nr:ribosome small subunit-dependent GTPase A [Rubrivivax sp.]